MFPSPDSIAGPDEAALDDFLAKLSIRNLLSILPNPKERNESRAQPGFFFGVGRAVFLDVSR